MFITVINDCQDPNAAGRQLTRLQSLLGWPATLIGVSGDLDGRGELEAAGNLVDVLDASEGRAGVVIVNVAPRSHLAVRADRRETRQNENGSPFGYFFYRQTLVLSSLAGLTLSLVKKFDLMPSLQVLNIPEVLNAVIQLEGSEGLDKESITTSQFRSYEFLPRVAQWLLRGMALPSQAYRRLADIPRATRLVWWVDNFGNCKTTLLPEDVDFISGGLVSTRVGELPAYSELREVPNNAPALVRGSSGIGNRRFLEIVVQGNSAARHFNICSGAAI